MRTNVSLHVNITKSLFLFVFKSDRASFTLSWASVESVKCPVFQHLVSGQFWVRKQYIAFSDTFPAWTQFTPSCTENITCLAQKCVIWNKPPVFQCVAVSGAVMSVKTKLTQSWELCQSMCNAGRKFNGRLLKLVPINVFTWMYLKQRRAYYGARRFLLGELVSRWCLLHGVKGHCFPVPVKRF